MIELTDEEKSLLDWVHCETEEDRKDLYESVVLIIGRRLTDAANEVGRIKPAPNSHVYGPNGWHSGRRKALAVIRRHSKGEA